VETQMGGAGGGGARLTKLGRDVVGRYRAIEGAAAIASAADLRAFKASLPDRPFSLNRSSS
jgi:molybdate transport system regulatory protein